MSLMVAPELVAAAAADLTGIGQAISAANAAAAGPTTQVLAAAGDEVSAAIAALFGTHAQEYQALSARVATFHEQFVRSLTAAGSAYATAEAANASPLQALEQQVLGAINAPTQLWLGRPLIGDGVHGAPGTGQPGGAGGLLWGNGGNGGSGAAGQVGGPGGAAGLFGNGGRPPGRRAAPGMPAQQTRPTIRPPTSSSRHNTVNPVAGRVIRRSTATMTSAAPVPGRVSVRRHLQWPRRRLLSPHAGTAPRTRRRMTPVVCMRGTR